MKSLIVVAPQGVVPILMSQNVSQNGLVMAGKVPHLKERNGRYSARIVVPERLRPYLAAPDTGKRELETQLGGDLREAKRKLAHAVSDIQHRIGFARERYEAATQVRSNAGRYPLTIQQIAHRDYESQIKFDAEVRIADASYAQTDVDYDLAQRLRDGFAGKLTNDELEDLVGVRLRRFQRAGHSDAVKGSSEWRALAQALCVSSYEAIVREYERNEGDFSGRPTHPLLSSIPLIEDEPEPVLFDQIIDEEVKRRARGKDAKPLPVLTIKKYRMHCASFAEWRKDKNALSVTAAEGKAWVECLQDTGDVGNRTIKAMLQNVRTVLNWGRQNDPANFFSAGNPLIGIKAPDYTTAPSYLRAFTMDEAKLVLAAARKEEKAALRWVPWLCAYSGMRVSEAGRLRKEDFFQSGGRWFWKVTTAGGRSLKNSSSERRVPVHQALVDEGFIKFLNGADDGRLFKGETKEEVQVQPRISEWVRDLIPHDLRPELSPNHGWRHLFEDLCRRDLVPEDAQNYMTGRSGRGSQAFYGRSEVMLPGLAAAMDRISPIPV
ncbi:integrase [Roseibium litorale]|uniref:Integrase n=1 Tax=Roseibium litorale TaxID=2803841 RepID=A0ABR9CTK9_9HYPH|nr:integrase [Roseibium litorale]MBD8894203.1 integrase [Roseibium litorale]